MLLVSILDQSNTAILKKRRSKLSGHPASCAVEVW